MRSMKFNFCEKKPQSKTKQNKTKALNNETTTDGWNDDPTEASRVFASGSEISQC